jgi:methionyl-tRNA synthetase
MKPVINYEDFVKLDIRAGLIVAASAPEWSEKLIRYEIDLGEEIGKRILFSGVRKWYKPEEIVGKKVPVVVNLAPKKMGTEESAGMVLMLDTAERPVLIFLPEDTVPGSVVR